MFGFVSRYEMSEMTTSEFVCVRHLETAEHWVLTASHIFVSSKLFGNKEE